MSRPPLTMRPVFRGTLLFAVPLDSVAVIIRRFQFSHHLFPKVEEGVSRVVMSVTSFSWYRRRSGPSPGFIKVLQEMPQSPTRRPCQIGVLG